MAKFAVRPATEADWPGVEAVLTDWLREYNPSGYEAEVRYRMGDVLPNAWRCGVAADHGGTVIGVAMLSEALDAQLAEGLARPVEIVSVYIQRDRVGQGVGGALVSMLEAEARGAGFSHVIACSGPRNAEFGYPFWNRRYGPPVRTDPDYWAPGAERVVWQLPL